ncbi:BolA-like protein 2 [Halotydeus destructor]|nr:BolA-like protein 2 [Halotydeus destructor]
MSGYSSDYITDKLRKELEATHLDIVDVSDGCGAKFDCVIVSPQFAGKPLIARHRLVNSVLSEELKVIHAFTMKTLTPEQWQNMAPK